MALALFTVLTSPLFAQTISVSGSSSAPSLAKTPLNSGGTPASVLITGFNSAGIALVPSTSPQFASLLATAIPPSVIPAVEGLLPYSVLIKNGSSKSIIAHALSWVSIDSAGQHYTDFHTVCDFVSLKRVIAPGAVGLATVLGTLNNPALASDQRILADIAEQAQTLRDKASVTISLEALVFEDGTSIGNDAPKAVPQIRGRLKAEYDLYRAVLDAGSRGGTEVTSWLKGLAAALPPWSQLKFGTDPFPTWYQYYEARLAANLVDLAAQRGLSEMVAHVRSTLQSKPYPPLLVN